MSAAGAAPGVGAPGRGNNANGDATMMGVGADARKAFGGTTVPRGRLTYFLLLDAEQQRAAIQRMAASRMGDHIIAAATGLAVEQVRRILESPSAIPEPM